MRPPMSHMHQHPLQTVHSPFVCPHQLQHLQQPHSHPYPHPHPHYPLADVMTPEQQSVLVAEHPEFISPMQPTTPSLHTLPLLRKRKKRPSSMRADATAAAGGPVRARTEKGLSLYDDDTDSCDNADCVPVSPPSLSSSSSQPQPPELQEHQQPSIFVCAICSGKAREQCVDHVHVCDQRHAHHLPDMSIMPTCPCLQATPMRNTWSSSVSCSVSTEIHYKPTMATTHAPEPQYPATPSHTPQPPDAPCIPPPPTATPDSSRLQSEISQLQAELSYALRLLKLAHADRRDAELQLCELRESARQREAFLSAALQRLRTQHAAATRARVCARGAIFEEGALARVADGGAEASDDGADMDGDMDGSRVFAPASRLERRRSSGIGMALVPDPVFANAALVQTRMPCSRKGSGIVL